MSAEKAATVSTAQSYYERERLWRMGRWLAAALRDRQRRVKGLAKRRRKS